MFFNHRVKKKEDQAINTCGLDTGLEGRPIFVFLSQLMKAHYIFEFSTYQQIFDSVLPDSYTM